MDENNLHSSMDAGVDGNENLLSFMCNINSWVPKSFLRGKIELQKTEEVRFHFLVASAEHCGVNSLYFIYLVNDIENVLFKEHEHTRKTKIHTN